MIEPTYLIEVSLRCNVRLDMRNLVDKAYPDYIQHRNGDSESHWKDLVRSTLEEQCVELRHESNASLGRQDQKEVEYEIIRQIFAQYSTRAERAAAWTERTGKHVRAFYRRLREMRE